MENQVKVEIKNKKFFNKFVFLNPEAESQIKGIIFDCNKIQYFEIAVFSRLKKLNLLMGRRK